MHRVLKKKGLDYFLKNNLLDSLIHLMKDAFPDCDPLDIISTMEDSTQYFIKKDKKIVALLSLVEQGGFNRVGDEYPNMIFNVATDCEYRRQGLMKQIFERMQKDVDGKINLEVYTENKRAIRFYKKMGFKKEKLIEVDWDKKSFMFRKFL